MRLFNRHECDYRAFGLTARRCVCTQLLIEVVAQSSEVDVKTP